MVLGADGVHSRTRQAMQSLAAGGSGDEDRPSPFVTTYRALLGNVGAPLPGLPPGSNYEGAADGVSTQVLTATGRAWFAVYEALEGGPTPRRRRWTAADADAVLARWGHLYAAPGYTVNQIRALADASGDGGAGPLGLISLEEGLLDTWWWRRIVLVGDAVRKLEPHAGLGYNAGVSDLAELVNGLRALTAASTALPPTTADLEALFAAYQARRAGDSPALTSMSARRARLCAWLGPHHWLVARFAVPWLPLARRAAERVLGPLLARAPVLAWLPERRLPARAVPYLHHPRLGGDDGNDNDNNNNNSSKRSSVEAATPLLLLRLPLFAGAVVFATLATVGVRFYRRV
ncbi:putative FAD binding domain-containing protein [Rosellinia necatrix]|uniref:Putative FAD binding domain-containing protein n=1 Tax=Rosellinia necatrix TaxID=77044 RepID=A0A1W2TRA0_ROSNE|nr:putative FAD binding domain-containing protein [Rosellinia necatrix]